MQKKVMSGINRINPLMYEKRISNNLVTAYVSLVGGFLTRLNIKGYDLLYLDPEEYYQKADLKSSKHYGAPFLSPPGINRGFPRHGCLRNTMWEVVGNSGRTLAIQAAYKGILYNQTYKLENDTLTITVNAKNEYRTAQHCETGFHYYFNIDPSQIDFANEFNELSARDNISGKELTVYPQYIQQRLNEGQIDLHLNKIDRSLLRFRDKQRDVQITLGIRTPLTENNTFVIFADKELPGRTAVETWSAPQGTIKINSSGNVIAPGKEKQFIYTVAVEKRD
jgi:galactose mutarotase-like enzyme